MGRDPTEGTKKYYGKYRGQVADRNDPEILNRVKCFVPEVLGNEIPSHWATIATPAGGMYDYGSLIVPPKDAGVWVEFEAGDVNRPIVTGYWYSMPKGESEVPKHARGLPDETDETKGTVEGETIPFLPPPEDGEDPPERPEPLKIQEPPSPFSGQYPDVIVFKSQSGHMLEFDDTDGEERIHIFHRIGSYREIRRDGSVVDKAIGSSREIVTEDKVLHILGKEYRLVEQNADLTYRRDKKMVVAGSLKEEVQAGKILVVGGKERKDVAGESDRRFGGPLVERIAGKRSVSTGSSHDTTVGAQRSCTIAQTDSTVIGNQLGPTGTQPSVAKALQVLFGNYEVELTAGDQIFKLTLGEMLADIIAPGTSGYAWRVKALAGNAEMNLTAGNFDLKVTAGNIKEETQAGTWTAKSTLIATLESLLKVAIKAPVGIDVGDGSTAQINLGGASAIQPLVLGTSFMILWNAHVHLGGTLGGGLTGIPAPGFQFISGVHSSLFVKTK
jgi:hypothetical protein